jgi:hypothetical protein
VAAPALYSIAIGQDNDAVYTSTPLKGSANQYQDGDIIANVFDANGGAYSAAAITDNGVRTASTNASLPAGLELDPVTGQVRVLDHYLLVAGTYPVSFTTTDANGGVNTQTVSLGIGTNPLPIILTRFDAKAVGEDAQLGWATAQELDNAGFGIERSLDGIRFEALAYVPKAGTGTQVHSYAFVDAGVGRQHPGTVYYRLQQRDYSGKTTYSPVRSLAFAPAAGSVGLFPNPALAQTTLDLTSLPAATYQVTLVDLTGRVVQIHTLAGGQAHLLETSSLPSGSYLVIIRSGDLKIIQRLIMQ